MSLVCALFLYDAAISPQSSVYSGLIFSVVIFNLGHALHAEKMSGPPMLHNTSPGFSKQWSAELEWKGETLDVDMKCWCLGARPSNHTTWIGVYETQMFAFAPCVVSSRYSVWSNVGTCKCRIRWGKYWPLPRCGVEIPGNEMLHLNFAVERYRPYMSLLLF
jgi:hypothetical protein